MTQPKYAVWYKDNDAKLFETYDEAHTFCKAWHTKTGESGLFLTCLVGINEAWEAEIADIIARY